MKVAMTVILAGIVSACGGGGGGSGETNASSGSSSTPPTANAGADQRRVLGSGPVVLDGSNSSGTDAGALRLNWSFVHSPAGSQAKFTNADAAITQFTPDLAGLYRIQLRVSDGRLEAIDIVEVDVAQNTSPTASAGADQLVNRQQIVALDGSASADPDQQSLTYIWTQLVNGCPDVTGGTGQLQGVKPTFTSPNEICTLAFDLRVNDGHGDSFSDRVLVNVLEDKDKAVFVHHRDGADTNPGTWTAPKRTLSAAIMAASPTGADVYATLGDYEEANVQLSDRVSLYGGYSYAWERDSSRYVTKLLGGAQGLQGVGVSDLTLNGIHIDSAAASTIGGSSYGLRLVGVSNVTISRNTISTGNGAAGANGEPGISSIFNSHQNGLPGGPGACDGLSNNFGGVGGQAVGRFHGGAGGSGGVAAGDGDGQGGGFGAGLPGADAPGGIGGAGGNVGAAGRRGADGRDGPSGNPGAPATPMGRFTEGEYAHAQIGAVGSTGTSGGGGGGGGGGGAQVQLWSIPGAGNGGGGGGGGGAGGSGGNPGGNGGGSFGIVVGTSAGVSVLRNNFLVGAGGNGGAGGQGGAGSAGGRGGAGGRVCISEVGAGGDGGNGGRGGDGGQGGGGAGGPSLAIAVDGSSQITAPLDQNTFTLGNPASGGSPNGPAGTTADFHRF